MAIGSSKGDGRVGSDKFSRKAGERGEKTSTDGKEESRDGWRAETAVSIEDVGGVRDIADRGGADSGESRKG